MSEPVLALEGVVRDFPGPSPVRVLHGVDLALAPGELAALVGPSGSGKSTLLHVMGLLDTPTAGRVRVQGRDVVGLSEAERTAVRGGTIGFVFQFHHLLPALTAAENVALPLAIARGRIEPAHLAAARGLLGELGLGDRADQAARTLSGGQQQRVAIARALVHRPALVLADEPTGNLDSAAAGEAFELMRRMNQRLGVAFLVVTHDPRIAARCDRVVAISDGRITGDSRPAR